MNIAVAVGANVLTEEHILFSVVSILLIKAEPIFTLH